MPTAYTEVTPNAVASSAPNTMCAVSVGQAGLNRAATGSMCVMWPWLSVKPRGTFIQALAVTMKKAEATPETATGTPESQCARGESRSQPYR